MTTNTTPDVQPAAKSEFPIELPSPSAFQLIPVVSDVPPASDLESRVGACKAQLVVRLRELKMDTRLQAAESRDKTKAKLSELAHLVKWGIVDGWATASAPVTEKLEQWLVDSAAQLARKNGSSI